MKIERLAKSIFREKKEYTKKQIVQFNDYINHCINTRNYRGMMAAICSEINIYVHVKDVVFSRTNCSHHSSVISCIYTVVYIIIKLYNLFLCVFFFFPENRLCLL
jgi:hypothetical protein